jgi:hypothetical protein
MQYAGRLYTSSVVMAELFVWVDLMIASVALVYDLTLVTHNTAHLPAIPIGSRRKRNGQEDVMAGSACHPAIRKV